MRVRLTYGIALCGEAELRVLHLPRRSADGRMLTPPQRDPLGLHEYNPFMPIDSALLGN
jgi:hypothetical protein